GDGAVRRPEEHRRLRAADRLQLQPRRIDALPLAGQRVRRAARRCADDPRPAAGDDADADAHEQGRRRRPARRAGGARCDPHPVRPAARGRGHSPRHRSDHGHGTDRGERDGQLHRDRGGGALGRRARRRADARVRGEPLPGGLMRIAVFGARGQLGAAVTEECAPLHDTTTFARADLDIADERGVLEAMSRLRPDAIVNGIAYTDVDGAEDHAIEALNANAFAVRTLARAAAAVGAVLVHYSTDFVFDGKADAPYTEADRPNPRSVYAASKLLGEWFANDAPRSYVLRVE